jgi:hypothetical protein
MAMGPDLMGACFAALAGDGRKPEGFEEIMTL